MRTRQFNQKQKLAILESARKVGIKEAARMAGVHYNSVYQWRRRFEAMGKEAFLSYKLASPGRGVKKITAEQEEAVLSTWRNHTSFVHLRGGSLVYKFLLVEQRIRIGLTLIT